jgi:hypothetical protein
MKRGVSPTLAHTTAWSATGPWRISQTPGVRIARSNTFFEQMGLLRLSAHCHMQPDCTAMVRTRMPGGVGGGSCEASPYPDSQGWTERFGCKSNRALGKMQQ